MALNIGWTNHLLATRSAIRALIAKMERIAVAGTSPSGAAGQPLTPLPPPEWARLQQGLAQILLDMEDLVGALAPEEAARSASRQPVTATRYHLSLLVRELDQQLIADLDPRRGARYGPIAPEDHTLLQDHLSRIRQSVQRLQDDLERTVS